MNRDISGITSWPSQRAVTREHSLPALEAAHIVPYADMGPHEIPNSLLLRADLHKLFDRGYVTVAPDYTFRVSPRLDRDFHNGRIYYALEGREIARPADPELWPSRERLGWHAEVRLFGGVSARGCLGRGTRGLATTKFGSGGYVRATGVSMVDR